MSAFGGASDVALFWSRVTVTDGCWTHGGSRGSHGYPQATWEGRSNLAHRVSWMIANGSIPKGLFVCHRCNNKQCVRPDHLYAGTHKQNMDDMARAGHPRRKLSDEQVADIRARVETETQASLARKHGVSQGVIYLLMKGKTYRHVL
mgnify:CR=1 FL=1